MCFCPQTQSGGISQSNNRMKSEYDEHKEGRQQQKEVQVQERVLRYTVRENVIRNKSSGCCAEAISDKEEIGGANG